MPGQTRVKVSLGNMELEVEGSESFVSKYSNTIDAMLDRIRNAAPTGTSSGGSGAAGPKAEPLSVADDAHFGELILQLPKSANQTDQMLVAGWFAQRLSAEKTFITGDANQLLLEQGIKVGNPSQCMTNNLNAKRVFKHGKGYRISKPGEEAVQALLKGEG